MPARGRPKKYQTEEEKKQAAKELRKVRQQRNHHSGRTEFIHYAPTLPGIPTTTHPGLGLRVSNDVPIPYDPTVEAEVVDDSAVSPPQPLARPIVPLITNNREVTARTVQLETDNSQQEYEERILHATAAPAAAVNPQRTPAAPHRSRATTPLPHAGQPSGAQRTLARGSTTPSPRSIASTSSTLASSNSKLGSRRKRFPAQSNTLLSWVTIGRPKATPLPVPSSSSSNPPLAESPSSPSTPLLRGRTVQPALQGSTPLPPLAALRHSSTSASDHNVGRRTPAPALPSASIHPAEVHSSPRSGGAAMPAQSVIGAGNAGSGSMPPTEQTAYKLAKQLRRFQGCSHEQHAEMERHHERHHQRADVHSACSSFGDITRLLSGRHGVARPLPNVLSEPKLMKPSALPEGIDLQAAFEGTSAAAFPEDAGTRNEKLPRNLCLSQCHGSSRKGRAAKTRFDVDSVCCFPSSLGFAQNGIDWHPRAHAVLNLNADIHFSLAVDTYNFRGNLVTRNIPLHKIPHYCFGTVAGSIKSLLVFVFFPELHLESQHEHSTYLSEEDQQLWLDAALLPALSGTVGDAALASYLPASEDNARRGTTAVSMETLKRKANSREQLLQYRLQHRHLDPLWTAVRERINSNPGLDRFRNATLFVHAKNTKLAYMSESLPYAYEQWERDWAKVTDSQFYSRDRTYVDIAKTLTSEDYALQYDAVPDGFEAEVYLWRRCCLESHARTRVKQLKGSGRTHGSPQVTMYPWATTRDSMSMTLSAVPHGQESVDGLIYSQFYANIKTPFDDSKVYVFDNQAVENLALDPGYVRSLQQEGGGAAFSENVCKGAYLHSKARAFSNLCDNQRRSYGIREEHRISLTMMDKIYNVWTDWDLYDDSINDQSGPLPYYVIPSEELFAFLSAQINKYCFLFEYTLAHTARTYSLPETIVMVVALRALRFCYGSSILSMESLLYKDRWEQRRGCNGQELVVKEGLGIGDTLEQSGLGWFRPKFNWATVRLRQPHSDNILVGNVMMHAEYKRRWRAVKDLRDVFVRFHQAEGWYQQYALSQHPRLRQQWLTYLHALILEQFDADVWSSMHAAHKRTPELSAATLQNKGTGMVFSYAAMKKAFVNAEGALTPPHFVTGNKSRFITTRPLLQLLFGWNDKEERAGWEAKPYRLILQRCFETLADRLGLQEAERWRDDFYLLVLITHWVLPYATNQALIGSTKENRRRGMRRRMMWYSSVFADPYSVALPLRPDVRLTTLAEFVYNAHKRSGRAGHFTEPWEAASLIQECRKMGLQPSQSWVIGRSSKGTEPQAQWERGQPPKLQMQERIRGLTLDELDEFMVALTQEDIGATEEAGGKVVQRGDVASRGVAAPVPTSLRTSGHTEAGSNSAQSGSIYVPSRSSN